jgi:hypothetical protein
VDTEWRPRVTTVRAGDPDFFRVAGQWRMVAESRGRQMVAAGEITEDERGAALDAFTAWMKRADAVQTVHEAFMAARRPRVPRRLCAREGAGTRELSPPRGNRTT